MQLEAVEGVLAEKVIEACQAVKEEWDKSVAFCNHHKLPLTFIVPQPPHKTLIANRTILNFTCYDAVLITWGYPIIGTHTDENNELFREACMPLLDYDNVALVVCIHIHADNHAYLKVDYYPDVIQNPQKKVNTVLYSLASFAKLLASTLNVPLITSLIEFCDEEVKRLREVRLRLEKALWETVTKHEQVQKWMAEVALKKAGEP